jgi:predicted DNA-binding WGR domain protein
MTAVILYRIDSAKRMQRFYRMDVQPDLFGQWCLMREWGRIGSSGRVRSMPFGKYSRKPRKQITAIRQRCQCWG